MAFSVNTESGRSCQPAYLNLNLTRPGLFLAETAAASFFPTLWLWLRCCGLSWVWGSAHEKTHSEWTANSSDSSLPEQRDDLKCLWTKDKGDAVWRKFLNWESNKHLNHRASLSKHNKHKHQGPLNTRTQTHTHTHHALITWRMEETVIVQLVIMRFVGCLQL